MANNNLLATDTFASGSLDPSWAIITGDELPTIVGNKAQPTHVTTIASGVRWTGLTWPSAQISEVTCGTFTQEANTFINLELRIASGSFSGYEVSFSNNVCKINRVDSGTSTTLVTVS